MTDLTFSQYIDCSKEISKTLNDIEKSYKKREERLKKITALYKNTKNIFNKNMKEIANLDKSYKNIEYLLNLSEAYVERAKKTAIDGALCIVLAGDIMKEVFIPKVTGMKLREALRILRNKGLANISPRKTGEAPSKEQSQKVISQAPDTKKRVNRGTEITLMHYGNFLLDESTGIIYNLSGTWNTNYSPNDIMARYTITQNNDTFNWSVRHPKIPQERIRNAIIVGKQISCEFNRPDGPDATGDQWVSISGIITKTIGNRAVEINWGGIVWSR